MMSRWISLVPSYKPQQADVAVDPLDGHLAHVAAAAVDLHREIGYLADHFGAEQLGRRRGDPAVLTGHPEPRGVAHQRAPGQHAGLLIGDHRLHQLEIADRSAALRRGGGVGDGFVERALRGSDGQRGDVDAAARQRDHRGAVADVLAAADQRAVRARGRRRS